MLSLQFGSLSLFLDGFQGIKLKGMNLGIPQKPQGMVRGIPLLRTTKKYEVPYWRYLQFWTFACICRFQLNKTRSTVDPCGVPGNVLHRFRVFSSV